MKSCNIFSTMNLSRRIIFVTAFSVNMPDVGNVMLRTIFSSYGLTMMQKSLILCALAHTPNFFKRIMNTLNYKGYISSVAFSEKDNVPLPSHSKFSEEAIQHNNSEQKELFVHDSMQICPEEFDFGIE